MAFTKEDKDYLGLLINPLKDGISKLNEQMKAHDDETSRIKDTQKEMIGGIKIIGWVVVPIFVSVITWWITKG